MARCAWRRNRRAMSAARAVLVTGATGLVGRRLVASLRGDGRAARGAEPLGIRTVRLRIGIVLARDGGALPRIAQVFRVGLGGRLGDGRQWFPWISLEDVVALIVAAIGDPSWSGAVNAVAPGV